MTWRLLTPGLLLALLPASLTGPPGAAAQGTLAVAPAKAPPEVVLRPQQVRPLPGGLDSVLVLNDNNPELIRSQGILLSSFEPKAVIAGQPLAVPGAHLDLPLQGRFELFSHHVYAGRPESADSTLWLGVVAAPRGTRPVRLRLVAGATALSQSNDPRQPAAPFLPLPPLLSQNGEGPYAGPGSRVAGELLTRQPRNPLLSEQWTLLPGQLTTLLALPLPVRGLDPLLNGRNLQLRLESDGPVSVATLASLGGDQPPAEAEWALLLQGDLSPKEHPPSPLGSPGPIIYSRVSGLQQGSLWRASLSDPGKTTLSVRSAPVSWPISSLERGRLGSGQVQTALLKRRYPETAWAAHGNYGIEYDLTLPLLNDTSAPVRLQLALDSPLKGDAPIGGLRFNVSPPRAVTFRGLIEVQGLDGPSGRASGPKGFHLVLRQGQSGPALGTVSLAPRELRRLRVRLIYPADATPPQALTLLPIAESPPAGEPRPAVKQSGVSPGTP
ncbi:DUF3370 domain-containing protein [Cyanobium sp. ATX 6F1]|uniref:DUF3370 domain-containing protein n=1 Tax=Cyanobium sp. ATX 6F1 TaxID=2823702 RepID=UPI0020CBFA76|nr:DUF3370 domain-containing protein [Cyanobium sp. ATX 6F1]MCP9915006.1 DUF3370 domain-containing protein [Cyanobium sp. ATX 6F1]